MDTLVVVPTYNEAATISDVLTRTLRAAPEVEILVVDDESPDGTADLADSVASELGGIHVLRRKGRAGFGDAYRTGFAWGLERGARVLVQMDADLSHDPAAVPVLIAALDDYDVAVGSRYVPGGSIPQWGWHRRVLSRGGNVYARTMLGLTVQDVTSGFRAYRSEVFRSVDIKSVRADGYGFQIEMVYLATEAGFRLTEVPIQFKDRELGDSKMTGAIIFEAALLVTRRGISRAARRLGGSKPGSRVG